MKNLKNDNSGFVIVAVIVLSIVMMIFAIGIISLNSSSAISTQHQIDRLKLEQLGKGAHWANYMSMATSGNPISSLNATMDGKSYSVSVNPGGTGPNSTTTYDYDVNTP